MFSEPAPLSALSPSPVPADTLIQTLPPSPVPASASSPTLPISPASAPSPVSPPAPVEPVGERVAITVASATQPSPSTPTDYEALRSDYRLLESLEKHSFLGNRLIDTLTAASSALMTFSSPVPIEVAAILAYVSAAFSLSFKAAYFVEHHYRQKKVIKTARQQVPPVSLDNIALPNPKNDKAFYLIALLNLGILLVAPSCKFASKSFPDNEALKMPWIYMACIIAGLLTSTFLEIKVKHHGEEATHILIKKINERRATATATTIHDAGRTGIATEVSTLTSGPSAAV